MSLKKILALVIVSSCMMLAFGTAQSEQTAVAEELPTLRFLWRSTTFDLPSDPGIQFFEEATGYTVEWNAVPSGEEGNRKYLLELSAGEEYDFVQSGTGIFAQLIGQDVIQPLDDLLADYGPNVLKALPQELWKVGQVEGKQMAVPQNIANRGFSTKALLARADILDKHGLAIPRNIDDLYRVLAALKDAEPDMIPLSYEAGGVPLAIQSGFGLTGEYQMVDGSWFSPLKNPGFYDCLEFIHKLYAEELLDPEMPAMKRASKVEKYTSGKAAFIRYDAWESGIVGAFQKNIPEGEYAYVPVLEDINGDGHVIFRSGYTLFTYIPKNAEHPKHAMKWLNTVLDDDVFKFLYLGEEGETYEVKDGAYYPILPAFNGRNAIWFYFPTHIDDVVAEYWQARVRKSELVADSYLTVNQLNDPYEVESPLAYAPTFESQSKLGASVNQYVNDEILKFIVGARDLSEWDDFLQEYDAKGGAEIEAEIISWLKANN